MENLLSLLETNAKLTNKELAVMLGLTEEEVAKQIKLYEETGVIKGYKAIVDKSKADIETVTALIEIKVQPKYGHGFDEIAKRISMMEEVESIYLMSGGFDLTVFVTDKSFHEVAMFVAKRLSPLEGVVSTGTHFILKKYKEQNVLLADQETDDRRTISL